MAIDVEAQGSPGWWFNRLAQQQVKRLRGDQENGVEGLEQLWDRLRGQPPLPEVDAEVDVARRRAWRAFQRRARTNYAELIVSAVTERMTPTGFRTGADDDENGDTRARDIWVANELPVEAADVHEFMVALGTGYTIVGFPDDDGIPVVTGEDPRQVITAHDPARPRRVLAGLKWYYDDVEERDVAHIYLPGQRRGEPAEMHTARRDAGRTSALGRHFRLAPQAWTWDEEPLELPVSRVPVVRFRNRRGVGEFEPHVDLLDRINHMLLQRLVIATLQAFRQRAVKGVPIKDPRTGEKIDYTDVFTADPGALWLLPSTAELWESGQVDLTPMLSAVRDDVRDLSAVTRTALSYLSPDAANESAEGASLQREGGNYKAEDRCGRAGSSWAQTLSLAFEFANDAQRADLRAIETLWRPVERYSLAERFDAVAKAKGVLPWRDILTDVLQYTPARVGQMEVERITDVLLAGDTIDQSVPPAPGDQAAA